MYDGRELLWRIDHHTAPILIGFGLAMVFQTLLMVSAVRVAARDRHISIPLFCTFFWFAHDLGCVVRFDTWFHTYDHWFMKCFWVGLLSALLLEFVYFTQILKYGRQEYAPSWTQAQFAALIAAGAVVAVVAWEYFRSMMGDPLYFAGPAPTMVSYVVFGAALYLRRRSAVGQSIVMWGSFTAMAVAWWVTVGLWFTAAFRSWQYIAMGAVCFLGGLAMTARLTVDRRHSPAAAAARRSPERVAVPS